MNVAHEPIDKNGTADATAILLALAEAAEDLANDESFAPLTSEPPEHLVQGVVGRVRQETSAGAVSEETLAYLASLADAAEHLGDTERLVVQEPSERLVHDLVRSIRTTIAPPMLDSSIRAGRPISRLLVSLAAPARADLLAESPADRSRYESLGLAILLKVLVIGSFTFLAGRALGISPAAAVMAGAVTGLCLGLFDRIALQNISRSSGGQRRLRRFVMLAPRCALSLAFATMVAAPILVGVFGNPVPTSAVPEVRSPRLPQGTTWAPILPDSSIHELPKSAQASDSDTEGSSSSNFADDPGKLVVPVQLAGNAPTARDSQSTTLGYAELVKRPVPVAIPTPYQGAARSSPTDTDLIARLRTARQSESKARAAVTCERTGSCGSGRAGTGPVYREKLAQARAATAERRQVEREIQAMERSRLMWQFSWDQSPIEPSAALSNNHSDLQAKSTALLQRQSALNRLVRHSPSALLLAICLLVLITSVEIFPILTKLAMVTGKETLYEKLLRAADIRADKALLDPT